MNGNPGNPNVYAAVAVALALVGVMVLGKLNAWLVGVQNRVLIPKLMGARFFKGRSSIQHWLLYGLSALTAVLLVLVYLAAVWPSVRMFWGKRAAAKAAVVANAKQAAVLQEKKDLIDKVRLFDRLTSLDVAQRRSALREVHRHVYGENPEAVNLDRDILSALSRLRQSPDALERFLADRAWEQAVAAK